MSAASTPKVLDIIRTAAADCDALGNTMSRNDLLEAAAMVRELLEALQALMTDFGGTTGYPSASPEAAQARAAIVKATGATE